MKTNILPIIMQGSRNVLKKNSSRFVWKGDMSIKVLDEISYKDFEDKSPQQAAQMVHDLFLKHLGKNWFAQNYW